MFARKLDAAGNTLAKIDPNAKPSMRSAGRVAVSLVPMIDVGAVHSKFSVGRAG